MGQIGKIRRDRPLVSYAKHRFTLRNAPFLTIAGLWRDGHARVVFERERCQEECDRLRHKGALEMPDHRQVALFAP